MKGYRSVVHLGGGVVEATLRGVQTSRAGAVKEPHLTIEDHFSYSYANSFAHCGYKYSFFISHTIILSIKNLAHSVENPSKLTKMHHSI
jgi:hypothetical protein